MIITSSCPFWIFGSAPVPYAPTVMGSAAVPFHFAFNVPFSGALVLSLGPDGALDWEFVDSRAQ